MQVLSSLLGFDQVLPPGSAHCSRRGSPHICIPGDFEKLYEVDSGFGIPFDVHLGMSSTVGRRLHSLLPSREPKDAQKYQTARMVYQDAEKVRRRRRSTGNIQPIRLLLANGEGSGEAGGAALF